MADPPGEGKTSIVNLFDYPKSALVTRSRKAGRNRGQVIGKALRKAFNGHRDCVRRRPFVLSGGNNERRSSEDADMEPPSGS